MTTTARARARRRPTIGRKLEQPRHTAWIGAAGRGAGRRDVGRGGSVDLQKEPRSAMSPPRIGGTAMNAGHTGRGAV